MDLQQISMIWKFDYVFICIILVNFSFNSNIFGNACELTILPKTLQLKEGDNVTFRCRSSPCPYIVDVTWTFDDIVVSSAVNHLSYVNTHFVTNSSWYFSSIDKKYNNSQLFCNSTLYSDYVQIILDGADTNGQDMTTSGQDVMANKETEPEVVFLIVSSILFVLALICLGIAIFLFIRMKGAPDCCTHQVTEVRRRISTTLRGKKTLSSTPLSLNKNNSLETPNKGSTNDAFTDVDREYSYADDPTKHYYLDLVDDSENKTTNNKEGEIYEDIDLGDVKLKESRS